jgi:hypothetical protein
MKNEYHELIEILDERTQLQKQIMEEQANHDMLGNIYDDHSLLNRKEQIKKIIKQVPSLKTVLTHFANDDFYVYIFGIPYIEADSTKKGHKCIQNSISKYSGRDSIATNFRGEEGYWFFDLLLPYSSEWLSFTDALKFSKEIIQKSYGESPSQLKFLERCTPICKIDKAFDIQKNFIVWSVNTKVPKATFVDKDHYSRFWSDLSLKSVFPVWGTSKDMRGEVGKVICHKSEKDEVEKIFQKMQKYFGDDFISIPSMIKMNWNDLIDLGLLPIYDTDIASMDGILSTQTRVMGNLSNIIEPPVIGDNRRISEKQLIEKIIMRSQNDHRPPVYNITEFATKRDKANYLITPDGLT